MKNRCIKAEPIALTTISPERTKELLVLAQNGDIQARNEIIEGNLGLVMSIVKQSVGKIANSAAVSVEDMYQDGIFGLYDAIKDFDLKSQGQFSTYAVYKIRGALTHAIRSTADTVRLPDHKKIEIDTIKAAYARLNAALDREPKVEEVYTYLEGRYTIQTISEDIHAVNGVSVISLDTKVYGKDDDEMVLGDAVADENPEANPEAKVEKDEHNKLCSEVLRLILEEIKNLPEKERYIVENLRGLNGCQKKTVKEIAEGLKSMGYYGRNGDAITCPGVAAIGKRTLAKIYEKYMGGVLAD